MKYTYSSIKLNNDSFANYIGNNKKILESIDGLSTVNIFVGSNNSGKSRFLRELMKIEEYLFSSDSIETKKYLSYVREISKKLYEIKNLNYAKGIISFSINGHGNFNEGDFMPTDFEFLDFSMDINRLKRLLNAIKTRNIFNISSSTGTYDINVFMKDAFNLYQSNKDEIEFILNYKIDKIEFDKFYIPILRSLNSFEVVIDGSLSRDKNQARDFFQSRTRQTYEIDARIKIFTGQDLYFEVRNMLLGDQDHRRKISEYEKFLSEELFGNKTISLIPKVDSDVLSFKIGEEEKKIYELGDGIQSLIILTFQLFMVDNGLFFIEEPELNLHPGMQRKFLEIILRKKGKLFEKNHQYFFTTHSNHFLDLTFDYDNISIYKFVSDNSSNKLLKVVEQVNSGDERLLKELGVKNSSVFLTNATIWIEGITDRLYIKKFLELYQDYYNEKEKIFEDLDYSFVEYGGNNITHWSFLDSNQPNICVDRLCGKSILITDKDGKNKITRQNELRKKLNERYICLSCREIENILSLNTLEKVIKKYPSEKNFIMPKFKDKYPHKDLKIGTFIQGKLKPKNNYKGKSGSLASDKKLDFCNKSIEDMKFEDMTLTAKNLAKKIYEFVLSQKT